MNTIKRRVFQACLFLFGNFPLIIKYCEIKKRRGATIVYVAACLCALLILYKQVSCGYSVCYRPAALLEKIF